MLRVCGQFQYNSTPAVLSILVMVILATLSMRSDAQRRQSPATRSRKTESYTFFGPDGDFSLAFPAKPSRSHSENEESATMIRHYQLSTSEGNYFSVNFQDVSGNPRSVAANEFGADSESEISEAARQRGETVTQIRRLTKNTIEMEVWQATSAEQKLHRIDRYIIRHARVYTLGCGSLVNGQEVKKSRCAVFFNSIRFTK
jgi:hypothetical protein